MSHYYDGIREWEEERERLYARYRRNNKPRIRCASFSFLVYRNKKKSAANVSQHQAKTLEAACDMALALI